MLTDHLDRSNSFGNAGLTPSLAATDVISHLLDILTPGQSLNHSVQGHSAALSGLLTLLPCCAVIRPVSNLHLLSTQEREDVTAFIDTLVSLKLSFVRDGEKFGSYTKVVS